MLIRSLKPNSSSDDYKKEIININNICYVSDIQSYGTYGKKVYFTISYTNGDLEAYNFLNADHAEEEWLAISASIERS